MAYAAVLKTATLWFVGSNPTSATKHVNQRDRKGRNMAHQKCEIGDCKNEATFIVVDNDECEWYFCERHTELSGNVISKERIRQPFDNHTGRKTENLIQVRVDS